jgi:hypothetical protein
MKVYLLLAVPMLLSACALKPTTDEPVAEQRSFRVGSHLPVRDKDGGSSTSVTNNAPPPIAPTPVFVPGKGGGAS